MSSELQPSPNANELWTYGLPQTTAAMDGDILIHPALHSRRILGVLFGEKTNEGDKKAFVSDFVKRVALVPEIQGLLITVPSRVWTPQFQLKIEEHLPLAIYVCRVTVTETTHDYEATITHVQGPDGKTSWSSVSVPLSEVNLAMATQILSLPTLRILTFLPPKESTTFDKTACMHSIRNMLMSFDTLRSIKMPLDFLGDVYDILSPLEQHNSLTNLEFKLPTTADLFPLATNNAVREEISLAVTGLLQSLRRLEGLAIPMEITSPTVLRAIGNLPRLIKLKVSPIGTMGGATFLNVALMNGIPSARSFQTLRVLNIDRRRTSESDLARLSRRFPEVTII
ncbi:hypothetical protein GALMADRAFT_142335 [Galerina marginata CBS 339.88]|uniref:Uncharacterized protein n=1 Tax=Galerina marginata (strain CBS 339.88) TaxID=685588 RepID=A0A067SQL6_GALM3|nr:hypothetical protein GALMADRAFT_142335 [Galerina marginata CBS 339.88]